MSLRTQDYPTLMTTLESLGKTDKERAVALDVQATKTIERLRRRLPAAIKPFIIEPRLLRALLADLEQAA